MPLGLFRDRNFSLANVAISVMGFAITSLAIPLMLWAQVVRGLSPTRSALLLVPMAVMTILLARPVGQPHRPGPPAHCSCRSASPPPSSRWSGSRPR